LRAQGQDARLSLRGRGEPAHTGPKYSFYIREFCRTGRLASTLPDARMSVCHPAIK